MVEKPTGADSFNKRSFIRALSYRDFVTSISLALLLLAFFHIVDYYSSEDWVGNNLSLLKWSAFLLLIPVNHMIYRLEHKRQNNFIGRNLHDHIFLLLFATVHMIYGYFYGSEFRVGFDDVGTIIFGLIMMIVLVMLFELLIAFLKRLLKLMKWQIL